MQPSNSKWDAISDDEAIVLTKGDVEAIMTCILQVQLSVINTQGLIKALKSADDSAYDDYWNRSKRQIHDASNSMMSTMMKIAERHVGESNGSE